MPVDVELQPSNAEVVETENTLPVVKDEKKESEVIEKESGKNYLLPMLTLFKFDEKIIFYSNFCNYNCLFYCYKR